MMDELRESSFSRGKVGERICEPGEFLRNAIRPRTEVNLLCRELRRSVAAKDGTADALGEGVVVADLHRRRGRREGHHGGRGVLQVTTSVICRDNDRSKNLAFTK